MASYRDRAGRLRYHGRCKECGAVTTDKRWNRCKSCTNMYSPLPGTPADPVGYAAETAKLADIDARITANGRCPVCELWLPCGGHKTAVDYVNQRTPMIEYGGEE